MAKQAKVQNTRANMAIIFTAAMGALLALVSLYADRYGETDVTNFLHNSALLGTMVGGVASGILYSLKK